MRDSYSTQRGRRGLIRWPRILQNRPRHRVEDLEDAERQIDARFTIEHILSTLAAHRTPSLLLENACGQFIHLKFSYFCRLQTKPFLSPNGKRNFQKSKFEKKT